MAQHRKTRGMASLGGCWAISGAHISAADTAIGMAVRPAKPLEKSYLIIEPEGTAP